MRIGMFVLTALPFKWLRALGVHEVAPLSYFRLWSVEVYAQSGAPSSPNCHPDAKRGLTPIPSPVLTC